MRYPYDILFYGVIQSQETSAPESFLALGIDYWIWGELFSENFSPENQLIFFLPPKKVKPRLI